MKKVAFFFFVLFAVSLVFSSCYEDQFRFQGESQLLDLIDKFSNYSSSSRADMIALTIPGSEAESFALSDWQLEIDQLEKSLVVIGLPDSLLNISAKISFQGRVINFENSRNVNVRASAYKINKKWLLRDWKVKEQPIKF